MLVILLFLQAEPSEIAMITRALSKEAMQVTLRKDLCFKDLVVCQS